MNVRAIAKSILRRAGLEVSRAASPQMLLRKLTWLRGLEIQTVLDVGANTGQFASLVREALPSAQIYSFEPLPECYARLVARMRGDKRFTAFPCALGDAAGEAQMHHNEFSPSSSLLEMKQLHKDVFPETAMSHPERIVVRRLDDVCSALELQQNVLVKVDVQGYESQVIAGGRATLSNAAVAIIETAVEQLYDGQPFFEDVFRQMQTLGFVFGGVADQLLDREGRPLQADVIFLRRPA